MHGAENCKEMLKSTLTLARILVKNNLTINKNAATICKAAATQTFQCRFMSECRQSQPTIDSTVDPTQQAADEKRRKVVEAEVRLTINKQVKNLEIIQISLRTGDLLACHGQKCTRSGQNAARRLGLFIHTADSFGTKEILSFSVREKRNEAKTADAQGNQAGSGHGNSNENPRRTQTEYTY